MCRSKSYSINRQLQKAIQDGMPKETIDEIRQELWLTEQAENEKQQLEKDTGISDYYHAKGDDHPKSLLYYAIDPIKAISAEWGFIAPSVQTEPEAYSWNAKPWANNINAQSEKVFQEKSVFNKAAKHGRCIMMIDAYYEHHHYSGKTYPFKIFNKDGSDMYVAAICRKANLVNPETGEVTLRNCFATLTCEANETLAMIHNDPKMVKRTGHRMLCLLHRDQLPEFLKPYPFAPGKGTDPVFDRSILEMLKPFPDELLDFYSVRNLHDRKDMPYIGNTPEIAEEYIWEDFDYSRVGKTENGKGQHFLGFNPS